MAQELDGMARERDRERSWMDRLIADIAALIEKLSNPELRFEPFFRRHAVDVRRRTRTQSAVSNF
jgi:hypothetical protein